MSKDSDLKQSIIQEDYEGMYDTNHTYDEMEQDISKIHLSDLVDPEEERKIRETWMIREMKRLSHGLKDVEMKLDAEKTIQDDLDEIKKMIKGINAVLDGLGLRKKYNHLKAMYSN